MRRRSVVAAVGTYLAAWAVTHVAGVITVRESALSCSVDQRYECTRSGFAVAPFLVWFEGREEVTTAERSTLVRSGRYVDDGIEVKGLFLWYIFGAEHLFGSWRTLG